MFQLAIAIVTEYWNPDSYVWNDPHIRPSSLSVVMVTHSATHVVIGVAVAVAMLNVASPSALSLAHGGAECGQNPMHAVQLVSQKTGMKSYALL